MKLQPVGIPKPCIGKSHFIPVSGGLGYLGYVSVAKEERAGPGPCPWDAVRPVAGVCAAQGGPGTLRLVDCGSALLWALRGPEARLLFWVEFYFHV